MMKPEPPTLQPDPPEGDRDTIERELARQAKGRNADPDADKADKTGNTPAQPSSGT